MKKNLNKIDAELGMIENAKHMGGHIDKYIEWNLSKFPFVKNARILDVGCGPCSYFYHLMKLDPLIYFATDYSDYYINLVSNLMKDKQNCHLRKIDLLKEESLEELYLFKFDIVICFDVIEHIENDKKALENLNKLMKKTGNGMLFLKVPSVNSIYGENDKSIGHYRRYSKNSVRNLLINAGFEIVNIKYHNIFGIIPWWVIGRILKRKVALSSNESSAFDSLVPVFKLIENIITPPIGLSLNCVCKIA